MTRFTKTIGCKLILLIMALSLSSCAGNSNAAIVPYRDGLAYQPTFTTMVDTIPMTYTFQFMREQRAEIGISVRTNGVVSSAAPVPIAVGPIDKGVDYTLPLTFTLTGKGEGTILILFEPSPQVYIYEEVFVLATDEGVFLNDISRNGVYNFYLNELHRRGIVDDTSVAQRRDRLTYQRALTVAIDGTPTTLNYSLPNLFSWPYHP
jgi:hypothetical protein